MVFILLAKKLLVFFFFKSHLTVSFFIFNGPTVLFYLKDFEWSLPKNRLWMTWCLSIVSFAFWTKILPLHHHATQSFIIVIICQLLLLLLLKLWYCFSFFWKTKLSNIVFGFHLFSIDVESMAQKLNWMYFVFEA